MEGKNHSTESQRGLKSSLTLTCPPAASIHSLCVCECPTRSSTFNSISSKTKGGEKKKPKKVGIFHRLDFLADSRSGGLEHDVSPAPRRGNSGCVSELRDLFSLRGKRSAGQDPAWRRHRALGALYEPLPGLKACSARGFAGRKRSSPALPGSCGRCLTCQGTSSLAEGFLCL